MNIKKATALLTLTFFLIAVLFGCAKGAEFDNKSNNIAIITKGSDSTFWNFNRYGCADVKLAINRNSVFLSEIYFQSVIYILNTDTF